MSMTTMIATYQQAKRERDELETQIRTLRSNRAQLLQRLTETEATLAAGQQGRVDELLQGKENVKSVNKAVGLTLFAQDARRHWRHQSRVKPSSICRCVTPNAAWN